MGDPPRRLPRHRDLRVYCKIDQQRYVYTRPGTQTPYCFRKLFALVSIRSPASRSMHFLRSLRSTLAPHRHGIARPWRPSLRYVGHAGVRSPQTGLGLLPTPASLSPPLKPTVAARAAARGTPRRAGRGHDLPRRRHRQVADAGRGALSMYTWSATVLGSAALSGWACTETDRPSTLAVQDPFVVRPPCPLQDPQSNLASAHRPLPGRGAGLTRRALPPCRLPASRGPAGGARAYVPFTGVFAFGALSATAVAWAPRWWAAFKSRSRPPRRTRSDRCVPKRAGLPSMPRRPNSFRPGRLRLRHLWPLRLCWRKRLRRCGWRPRRRGGFG